MSGPQRDPARERNVFFPADSVRRSTPEERKSGGQKDHPALGQYKVGEDGRLGADHHREGIARHSRDPVFPHCVRVDRPDGKPGHLDLPEEEWAAEQKRMNEELGRSTTRAERRVWWFARDSDQTVKQFTKANWWVKMGFNNRALEMFWLLTASKAEAGKSKRAFLAACKGEQIERYRGIGKVTIEEALNVLGYKRTRNRCTLCGAYTTPHYHGLHGAYNKNRSGAYKSETPGGKIPEVDRYIVTKIEGPKT